MKSLDRARTYVLLGALLGGGAAVAQERINTPEYHAVCDALVCQCGCNSTISTCAMESCHSAEPIREEIASRLQKGESPESIIEVFKERYGLVILSAPPMTGYHLVAWVTPFVALFIGFFITRHVLRSWKQQTAGGPGGVASMEIPPPSDAQRARIERELREHSR